MTRRSAGGAWRAWAVAAALAAGLAAGACGDDGATLDQADGAGGPDVAAPDAGGPDGTSPPAREVRRMTVEQLARSLPVVTGGIAWTEDFGQGETDILQVLSGTLGAPDYVLVVEENLEPSLIIAKFMADAAQRICAKWVARDRALPAGERTLIVHDDWASLDEADVEASLRALQLRALSRWIAPGDDAALADLYALFTAAAAGAPAGKAADDGWLAVCMATLTDPAFVLY